MPLIDQKITDAQIAANGVIGAPDKLNGTITENKGTFDRLIRDTVKGLFNGLIDLLLGSTAAGELGALASDGETASTVQAELDDLHNDQHTHDNKELLDDISEEDITNWDSAYDHEHTHENKSALDTVPTGGVVTELGADDSTVPTSKAVGDAMTASGNIPIAGMTGQVLRKKSDANYDSEWGTETLADVGGSNKNLLHNWDFRNPVNQRGQSSYSTNNAYTIDRWAIRSDNVTENLVADGLTITTGAVISAPTRLIDQVIEFPAQYSGKTLTLSTDVVDNTLSESYISIRYVTATSQIINRVVLLTGTGIFSITDTLADDITELRVTVGANTASVDEYITLGSMKLEIGSVSTLANDPPADYGEQLALCQRYFYLINPDVAYGALAVGQVQSATEARFAIIFPTKMRIAPSFVYSGSFRVNGGGIVFAITSIASYEASATSIRLSANTSGMTTGYAVMLQNDNDTTAYISFSADL